MFVGLTIGVLFAPFVFLAFELSSKKTIKTIACALALIIVFSLLGAVIDNTVAKRHIDTFEAQKETIENMLADEELTSFERARLVPEILEHNTTLAQTQFDMGQWYNIAVSDETKDAIRALKPIEK